MNLTNDSYVIVIEARRSSERYYRDRHGWLKVSARGRRFRATAEQVLNHLLPALAGIKRTARVRVEHYEEGARLALEALRSRRATATERVGDGARASVATASRRR